MKKYINVFLIVLSVIGFYFGWSLTPKIHPEWSISFQKDKNEISSIIKNKIINFGYDLNNYEFIVNYKIDRNLYHYLSSKYSIDSLHIVLNNYNFALYNITLVPKDYLNNITFKNNGEVYITNVKNIIYQLIVTPNGEIIKFEQKLPDDYVLKTLDSNYAYQLCSKFLLDEYTNYNFKIYDSKSFFSPNKKSIVYYARGYDGLKNEKIIQVEVANNKIYDINLKYGFEILPDYKLEEIKENNFDIITTIVSIILVAILLILMIQRLKRDEIDLKFGVVLGGILAFLYAFTTIYLIGNQTINSFSGIGMSIFIFLILFIVFFALFFILFSGIDSLARYYWQDKFHSFDALKKGYFFAKKVRDSIFNGFYIAGIFILLNTLYYYFIQYIFGISSINILSNEFTQSINILSTNLSFLSILSFILVTSITYTFAGPLFITSLLKMKIKNNLFVILFSSLIYSLTFLPIKIETYDIYIHLIGNFVFSIFVIIFFFKYDVLTIIFSFFFEQIVTNIFKFNNLQLGNSDIILIICYGIVILFIIFYIISSILNKDIDYEEIVPTIVKRISERERIEKEIEAARHIQQSFLPVKIPIKKGIDIYSICLPAYEVGGDYYDYFDLDEDKLAVVIGDVSGKGIKAAFYMTLIKGILKTQSQTNLSPSIILGKANKIFYELVEKGNFISIIYGIFDLKNKTFTYANAGHNPLIFRKHLNNNIIYDKNEGIALGLVDEETFNNNIKDKYIKFDQGDLFIFYTDGIIEAMNKNKEEYGEKRFIKIIDENSNNCSKEILNNIIRDVKTFIGKASQHDDITLLVIKIL